MVGNDIKVVAAEDDNLYLLMVEDENSKKLVQVGRMEVHWIGEEMGQLLGLLMIGYLYQEVDECLGTEDEEAAR